MWPHIGMWMYNCSVAIGSFLVLFDISPYVILLCFSVKVPHAKDSMWRRVFPLSSGNSVQTWACISMLYRMLYHHLTYTPGITLIELSSFNNNLWKYFQVQLYSSSSFFQWYLNFCCTRNILLRNSQDTEALRERAKDNNMK